MVAPDARHEDAVHRTFKRSKALEDEECQFDAEYARISLVQVCAPWAETSFGKYPPFEPLLDADTLSEEETADTGPTHEVESLGRRQRAKRLHRAADRLWDDTIAAAQRSNAKDESTAQQPAADLRRQRNKENAEKWVLHRRLRAMNTILQVDTGTADTEEQLRSLVTSEVRDKEAEE